MGRSTTTDPHAPTRDESPHPQDPATATHMGLPWKVRMVHRHGPTPLPVLPHLHTGDTGRMHIQNSTVFTHNGAMPAMFSANTATDAARHLADALANPAPAAPFACFGAQTMDAIRQLCEIYAGKVIKISKIIEFND